MKKANEVNKRYGVKVTTIMEDDGDIHIYRSDNSWPSELRHIVRPVNFTFIDRESY
jgi:hypothetical protein